MNVLETTLAAPFIHMRIEKLSQMKLIFYYTQDKRWMSLDDAKKLIKIGLSAGILKVDERGEFTLSTNLLGEKVPLGFRPTDEIFSAPLPEKKDVLSELLEAITNKSGLEMKMVVQEMNAIRGNFGNLIDDFAAAVLIAKMHDVDITPFRDELLSLIEG